MAKKSRLSLTIALVILLLVAVLTGYFFYHNNRPDKIAPKRGDVIEAVYGMGKVKARDKFEVKIGIITKVKDVLVEEGDTVAQNQKLITFDQGAPYLSPISGHVTTVNVNAGETALPQVPLIKVENLARLYIEVSLEQSSALKVKRGQKAKISFNDSNFEAIEGEVESIFPREDEFLVVIDAPALPQQVLPGMSPDVSIIVDKHQNSLLIPSSALFNDQVTRERDGKREKVKVTIGGSQGTWIQVLSGDVKESDMIIIPKKD